MYVSAPILLLLIWGVRGQSAVGSPNTRLVLMWLVLILLLPVVAMRPRFHCIGMMLGIALSPVIAFKGSLPLAVQHMMIPLLF